MTEDAEYVGETIPFYYQYSKDGEDDKKKKMTDLILINYILCEKHQRGNFKIKVR